MIQDTQEEILLIRRAQAGDTAAFEALVNAQLRFVYNLAMRALGNPNDAEDVVQETFLRAWAALPRFRSEARFRTWLYRIVINLCYNRLPRLRKDLAALPLDGESGEEADWLPAGPDGDPADRLVGKERRAFLQRQVNSLSEGYRALVLLRFVQELSYEEIAEVMQMPLGSVKTGLHRARLQLREALLAYERGDQVLRKEV